MSNNQPRNANGQFISVEELKGGEEIEFIISEFECRVIGNRLHRLADRYQEIHSKLTIEPHVDQDCRHWGKKFLGKCATREKFDNVCYENGEKRHTQSNYNINIVLTEYECWSLGNKLFEMGEWFEEKGHRRVAMESKWLGRRFHAEQKQQQSHEGNQNE